MRGTDPTKSKWECPTMFYICFYISQFFRELRGKRKLTDISQNQKY